MQSRTSKLLHRIPFESKYKIMKIDELTKIGLTEKESKIYITTLELGISTVQPIARSAGLKRSSTYEILRSLEEKGLVSYYIKRNRRRYSAASPDRLLSILTNRKTALEGLMPELMSVYHSKSPKPVVKFYEGLEGVRAAYEETLTAKSEILAYTQVEWMHKTLPDYFPEYYQRRTKKGIKIKAIYAETPEAIRQHQFDKEVLRESVVLPQELFDIGLEINIFDDKVAFMSLKEKFGMIIHSQAIADANKKIYRLAWNMGKMLEAGKLNLPK